MISGKEFKELRKNKGFTLKEVAKVLNTSEQAINKYELEIVRNIPLERVEKMAKLYGVSPAYIMEWDTPSSSAPDQSAALDPAEEHLMSVYRDLNNEGKSKLLGYADDLQASGRYGKKYDSVSGSVV